MKEGCYSSIYVGVVCRTLVLSDLPRQKVFFGKISLKKCFHFVEIKIEHIESSEKYCRIHKNLLLFTWLSPVHLIKEFLKKDNEVGFQTGKLGRQTIS